nr:zinc-finger domain of monoamine-oxidase A repressor R1 [Tanacetum cinerariifolium]
MAKAGGFISVSDMIHAKGAQNVCNYKRVKEICASPGKLITELLEENAQALDQISTNFDSFKTPQKVEEYDDFDICFHVVGVLIGKSKDTIQALQNNSTTRIQITRDAGADHHSINSQGVPSLYYLRERKRQDVECVKSDEEVQQDTTDIGC